MPQDKHHQEWEAFFRGKSTPEEYERLRKKLLEETPPAELDDWMKDKWTNLAAQQEAPQEWSEKQADLLRKIHQKTASTPPPSIRSTRRTWLSIAAGFVFLLAAGWWILKPSVSHPSIAQFQTQAGERTTIELSDGSTVWLNAGSSLNFTEGDERVARLRGEAFFDVNRNEEYPFVVETGKVEVKVLGTSFNVRAYDPENVQTTVATGQVAVSVSDEDSQTIHLTPGEQASWRNQQLKKETVSIRPFTAWKEGQLIFKNQPLSVIISELARWYGQSIELNDTALQNQPYTITVEENEKLEDFLQHLQLTTPIRYEYINQSWVIYPIH